MKTCFWALAVAGFVFTTTLLWVTASDTQTCDKGNDDSCVTTPTLQAILQDYSNDEVVSLLGSIYEHSPWVAEEFVTLYPLDTRRAMGKATTTVSQLAAILKQIVDQASDERQLALLRAHPDLRDKAATADELTPESQKEQASSGLSSLTADELTRFHQLNTAYREKFGFPFILAVRNASKHTILAALQGRVTTDMVQTEFVQALNQVHKIAWMRLLDKLDTSDANGFLTCHVLDTANGIPGKWNRVAFVVQNLVCAW